MRRSASRAARYAAQAGLSSRKHGCKWHYIFRKSWNSISLPTRNQRLARNLPMGLSKLGVDTMLSEHRDMAAAQAFFRSAKAVTGVTPDQVTTDGHGSYPRAIRSTLGRDVEHRTSAYKNNRLEQDHRGVKGRTRCMRGFKRCAWAEVF